MDGVGKFEGQRVAVGRVGGEIETPLDAELFGGGARHLDDSRLDHDGRRRRVQGFYGSGDLINVLLKVSHDDGVCPFIGGEETVHVDSLRSELANNILDVGYIGVGDREAPRHERFKLLLGLQVLDLLLRRAPLGFLFILDLGKGRDADNIVRLVNLGQRRNVRLEDDVKGLVPGHVGQPDSHLALDLRA